jgi:hypothetical protein
MSKAPNHIHVTRRAPEVKRQAKVGAVSAPEPHREETAPTARPERAPDDRDVGWGERAADPDDDDRRHLEDRPPHWGSD